LLRDAAEKKLVEVEASDVVGTLVVTRVHRPALSETISQIVAKYVTVLPLRCLQVRSVALILLVRVSFLAVSSSAASSASQPVSTPVPIPKRMLSGSRDTHADCLHHDMAIMLFVCMV